MATDPLLRPPSEPPDHLSETGGDEMFFPEGIYQRLDDLERNYAVFQEEEGESYEEVSEDEEQLDLTAPPPESWYHGNISRQKSYERLQQMSEPGAYLVRDSTNQPGDYAIAYLSRMKQIHHFKINSVCGDFYIGGRQFSSLVELIGYYTNCSCILENEKLEVPVMPPQPVRLHRLQRAMRSHDKAPGTDEVNIEAGEVFVLLNRLNEDWGWGQSHRTGESGLIPIVLMEDVSNEDYNFGKPWFHSTISRDMAIDLLQRKGNMGDFVVRPAHGPGQYSLAVKTYDKVQRFLVQKHATGYFVFGGRMFNSLDDIINRYKREVILDGLKLQQPVIDQEPPPLPMQFHPAYFEDPRESSRSRTNSVAINRDMPGDKTGQLLLRKGKKSPVTSKWRDFYFHLKFKEQKLLYYDNERSHRARGLIDLKECKIYPVHPSLYGRDDCFVVMFQYLNELSFYYMSAGSANTAQEWLRLMRQCVDTKKPRVSRSEVQQIRSLSLSVKECKLTKGIHAQFYCLINVDGISIARTKPVSETPPCVFDDNYKFEDLPPYSNVVSVDVTSMKKMWLPKDASLGGVELPLIKLPNGQDYDHWHTMAIPGTRASRGTLRLVATFKHEVILPLEEYRDLTEIILSDDLTTIDTLSKVCSEHHQELAATLIEIFCHHKKVLDLLSLCIAKAIEKENVSTLFRASTLTTMLMEQFMKLISMDYRLSILKQPIHAVMTSTESCEIDPSQLPQGTDIFKSQETLQHHVGNLLSEIYASVNMCPPPLKFLFHVLQEEVKKKWPTDEGVRIKVVSGFLFLRFIGPASLKPHLNNITADSPSPKAERNLKLVTKCVQNTANLVMFNKKEPFMEILNPFISKHMEKMKKFIDQLSNVQDPPVVNLPSSDPRRAWASLYRLCQTYEQKLQDASQTEPKILELLGIMEMLKANEQRFLSR